MSEDKDTPKDKYKDRKKAESDAAEEISGLADTTSDGFDRLSDNQEDLKDMNMAQVDAHEQEHKKLDILLERTREEEGELDEETVDEIYDELGGLYEEVVNQGEETREHTEREVDRALEEIHGRFDELKDEIDGSSDSGDYDSLKDTILDIAEEYERSSDETRSIREERNEDTSDILYD